MTKAPSRSQAAKPQIKKQKVGQPHFIRKWREKRNLSQEELAARIYKSKATISEIENRNTGYNQENLEAMALALDCHPIDLLVRDPDEDESLHALWALASDDQRSLILKLIRSIVADA